MNAIAWMMIVGLSGPSGSAEEESEDADGDLLDRIGWAGLERSLEDVGVDPAASYTRDLFRVASGGVRNEWESFGLLAVSVDLDLEVLVGLPRTRIFAQYLAIGSGELSDDVGDVQIVSNIEARAQDQLAAWWIETRPVEDHLRIKLGKVDANTEFAYVENGLDFVNSSMGFSPTIFPLTTFPDPAWGGLFEVAAPSTGLSLVAGAFDGAGQTGVSTGTAGASTLFGDPSDLLLLAEARYAWEGSHPGRVGLGYWHHTGDFRRFDVAFPPTFDDSASGSWFVGDVRVAERVGAFLQVGQADGRVSFIRSHYGGGVVLDDPLGRENDRVGLGATLVKLSNEPVFSPGGSTRDFELALELFWKARLARWLVVQPDLQYVQDPNGLASVEDALVAGVRVIVQL